MRKLLLLRPEPGLAASADRAREMGLDVVACPLFCIEQLEWEAPDPANYDALLITSANALRYGGGKLDSLKSLPVHAVGTATAEAAQAAGFSVVSLGDGDVAELLAGLPEDMRLLHLAGENHRETATNHRIDRRILYRSAPIGEPGLPPTDGMIIGVHSPRAAKRLAELVAERQCAAIAAISSGAAEAAGDGWERVEVADRPDDSSLLALAASLCHTSPPK